MDNIVNQLKESIESGETLDPSTLASKMIEGMTKNERSEVFQLSLTSYVRLQLAHIRNIISHSIRTGPPTDEGKAARRRSIAESFPINIPDVGYMRLADVTPDQLRSAANGVEAQAFGMLANVDAYRSLAKEIEDEGVAIVGDLDEDVVRRLLS
jgi:hypothetical protein